MPRWILPPRPPAFPAPAHMFITETELEENPDKYLAMAAEEDIFITKSGKTIAKLTSSNLERIQSIEELFGSIPADITLEEAREERLSKL